MIFSMIPLILFVFVATISPGGATTLATVSGANFGLVKSLPLLSGMCCALTVMAALAGSGLAVFILHAPALQYAMKILSSVYLLFLAWQITGRGAPHFDRASAKTIGFVGGIGLLWINPKAWAMTLGAAAAFSGLTANPAQFAAVLGMTFGVLSASSLTIWCLAGLLFAKLLRSEGQWRVLNIVLGFLLACSVIPMWVG